MPPDSVDRIIAAWAERDPTVDARPLAVVGRLLLCAHHCRNALVAALEPFGLSFGDFDVINTLRRRGDKVGTNPRDLARSALITSGAMTARLDRLERARRCGFSCCPTRRTPFQGRGPTCHEQACSSVAGEQSAGILKRGVSAETSTALAPVELQSSLEARSAPADTGFAAAPAAGRQQRLRRYRVHAGQ